MDKVNITIDGRKLSVPADYTVLTAAREAGIKIPTLCYLKDLNEIGACRMCLVELKGGRALQASCVYPVNEGMEVYTNSPSVLQARRANLELILSNHDRKCLTCSRNTNCELQQLASDLQIEETPFDGDNYHYDVDDLSASIVRDNNKCIVCRRCVAACRKKQSTSVIEAKGRGFKTQIGSPFDKSLRDVACIMCGQCILACPTGALKEKDHTARVWRALANKDLHVVVQTAPAVRIALGEEFGMPIGTRVTGKMAAALKKLGFARVFDTNTGADFTIMEEGTELIGRIQNGGKLPMITSCSPGWIKFAEHYYPEFLENLSSCKSPHTMFGALLKSYYAEKAGVDPKKIYVVSVMPCTAKKYEIDRDVMEVDGLRDVDAVITTRELAKMIKTAGINFTALEDEQFDDPFLAASGAAAIFGASGGVMEAALRTVAEKLTGKRLEKVEFYGPRGQNGIKEFTVELPQLTLKGCVVNGMANARIVLDKIKAGEADYHFIEIMGCPGGCVTGGGQPIVDSFTQSEVNVWDLRAKAIYAEDESLPVRRSHENPAVQDIYKNYLGEPNGHKAHHLLHTTYTARTQYEEDYLTRPTVGAAK
ncbi:ferredoxin [Clostridia bacterium]|nr:ferredoxin [Clostridia bacterium]